MRRYSFLLCGLGLATVLASPAVVAQESAPLEAIPPGPDRIVPLKLNMPAPFEGQLFDNATSLRWANWLKQYKLRLRVDVEEQKKLCAISTTALSQKLVIEEDKYKATVLAYDTQLARMRQELDSPPWYRSIWVGMVVGAGAAVVATLALVYSTK